ncbi:MAG: cysteine hydrolase family protein [Acidobacteriota bacterium]|jgi:nicotinamidase-related amidase
MQKLQLAAAIIFMCLAVGPGLIAGTKGRPNTETQHMDMTHPKTALLVVDIQNDYFKGGKLPLAGSGEAEREALKVVHVFRKHGWPVINIQHEGAAPGLFAPHTKGQEIRPNMAPRPGEPVFTKHHVNCFIETPLAVYLEKHHIKRLVIVGMQTNVCVQGAVEGAKAHGVKTIVLSNATAATTLKKRTETLPLLEKEGAEVMTVKAFLSAVSR